MSETTIVCESCKYALLEGAEIPAEWCAGCDKFVSVEEPHLIPEAEPEYRTDVDDFDAYQPSQQSAEREPVRQPVNGWPGRKMRKAKGRRNG